MLAFFSAVSGHASLIMPPTRNSIDAELPAWSGGKHPMTGWIEPYNCSCTNGTDTCSSGQSCFWFSQGCTIGCDACDGDGRRFPKFDHCPGKPKPPPTYLDKKYWTANQHAEPGSYQDIFQYNPWRAPGTAPVYDACGMAGGSPREVFNAGAYNATKYAKIGDLGSRVLPVRPSGTVWERGSVATTRWQQTAAHGGGYIFRLCPRSEPLTEACFRRLPLEFAEPYRHVARFKNSSLDRVIKATPVTDGPAKGWMRLPLPNPTDIACDYVVPAGTHCPWAHNNSIACPGCRAPWYAADTACPTRCSDQFPGLPAFGGSDPTVFPDPLAGHEFHHYAIEDQLKVPTGIAPGEYVLSWRWDCEMSSQVWSSCADITIV